MTEHAENAVGGRTTRPTRAEVEAHAAAGGMWLLVLAPFRTNVPTELVSDPLVGPANVVTLYIPLNRLWRPAPWPRAASDAGGGT